MGLTAQGPQLEPRNTRLWWLGEYYLAFEDWTTRW